MKKPSVRAIIKLHVITYIIYGVLSLFVLPQGVHAQFNPDPGTPNPEGAGLPTYYEPLGCASGQGDKAPDQRLRRHCLDITATAPEAKNNNIQYPCTESYAEWLQNPSLNFWVDDPEVTSLGKGGERSRQFLLWALSRQSIDDHPVILDVWRLSQNVALFLVLLVIIMMGIGIIIGKRSIGVMGSSFSMNVEITPLVIRIALLLLFIVFSARIVLLIVQMSDVLMEFFIRQLGVRDLFNIFFVDTGGQVRGLNDLLRESESAYKQFLGCTNWNVDNQEMVTTSKALVKFTNMTYYFIGGMLILRKIVLWFLIMVSPFLAILAPFVFIRNIGWIWIGVFFQWVFYGPLMALFLGGLSNIWRTGPVHIPYIFDFSRTHDAAEVVYPTSINILYGGPAQRLGLFNTSNYVDTFAEYLISLLMLWTVLILPWWLLRIFRDYCCDGIYAMKNILLSMYDQMRTGGGPGPTPSGPTKGPTTTGSIALELPQSTKQRVETTVRLETPTEIRQAQTEQIVRSMNIQASTLTDVARMETNTAVREEVTQRLDQIQNPFKAETTTERQRIMNIRNEVQSRAARGDDLAQRVAAVTAKSSTHERVAQEKLLGTLPKLETVPVRTTTMVKVDIPKTKQQTIVHSSLTNISRNQEAMQTIAQQTNTPVQQASGILQTFARLSDLDTSTEDTVSKTAQEVGIEEARVRSVISKAAVLIKSRPDIIDIVARQENLDRQTVADAVQEELRGAVGVTTEKTQKIVQRVLAQVSYDNNAVAAVAQQSQIQPEQARKVLQVLGQAEDYDVSPKDVVDQTASQVGMKQEEVRRIVTHAALVVGQNKEITQTVATTEEVDQETVEDVAKTKLEVLSKADKDIEDYVPETKKVSIEDYEEVKSMWIEHYENGEIPVTENVKTRQEWVEQDVVRISNILNKLMSPNRQLQEQGLNEVGYILPIFMVNNLTGEELLVYLKAKIQAAKQISRELKKEKAVREKMKDQEELVEIETPKKKAAAKQKTLSRELPDEESAGEEDSGGGEGPGNEKGPSDKEGSGGEESSGGEEGSGGEESGGGSPAGGGSAGGGSTGSVGRAESAGPVGSGGPINSSSMTNEEPVYAEGSTAAGTSDQTKAIPTGSISHEAGNSAPGDVPYSQSAGLDEVKRKLENELGSR